MSLLLVIDKLKRGVNVGRNSKTFLVFIHKSCQAMHSADVNQAITIILVELYPIISAEDVTVYVSIFQRSSSFFLQ